jgi:2-methylcitrate dehydratase PrpD
VTLLERLGAHAAGGYRSGLSSPVRDVLKLHIADTVAAWIAACTTAEGRALLAFEPPERAGMPGRVGLACALARLSEVDDIHLASGTTPGAIVVPAALTIGAALGRNGAELGCAIAAGYDLMTRLGAALGGAAILYRGIWPTYFAAPFAVAGVAARLLGLGDREAAHALAIALVLASPSVGRQSGATMSRWLAVGNAARSGVTAALAARDGFTGDLHLLDGEILPWAYQMSIDGGALLDGLEQGGRVFQTSFKPWCAARQTMAAAQALRDLLLDGLPPRDIERLIVRVPLPYLKMIDHGVVHGERTSFLTSVSYQMALAAFEPDASIDPRQARDRLAPEVERFMAKVSVVSDEDLLRHFPESWPALVSIEASGRRRERLVLHVPGDPERPLDALQVATKFWRLVEPLLGEHAADDVLRRSFAALDGEGGARSLLEAIDGAVAAASRVR